MTSDKGKWSWLPSSNLFVNLGSSQKTATWHWEEDPWSPKRREKCRPIFIFKYYDSWIILFKSSAQRIEQFCVTAQENRIIKGFRSSFHVLWFACGVAFSTHCGQNSIFVQKFHLTLKKFFFFFQFFSEKNVPGNFHKTKKNIFF